MSTNAETHVTRRFMHRLMLGGSHLIVVAILLAVTGVQARAGDDVPGWLRQAAATNTASGYEKIVPAVVLLSERDVRVEEDGKITTTERLAVKILTNEGRAAAVGSVGYVTDTGKVRDMRAWVLRPSGAVKKFSKDEVLDLAAAPNDVFNEVRVKVISGRDEVEVGAVFGCEWTSEERSVFTQFDWQFQERLPALLSRFTISLPPGWRAEGVTLNHSKIEASITGSAYTWELRDLPYIEDEPASPEVTTIAPRLAVSYFPPAGGKGGIGRAFNDWRDVSRWLTELSDSQAGIDDALATKARQLTANAKTELDRIKAIGRYA